jgi:2-octaprenylphenol hydroxylase
MAVIDTTRLGITILMSSMKYDVVIVGGGMAGLAMAAMLAQCASFSIAVLESRPQFANWQASQPCHRISAFAMSSQRIFKSLGIWKTLVEKRVSPFERIDVLDAQKNGSISFDSREISEPVLGYIIENNLIEATLTALLNTYSNVQLQTHVKLQTLMNTDHNVLLTLTDGSQVQADLVIAADGAYSWLRQAADIQVKTVDYHQKGLVATVTTEHPHQKIARQHFLSTGPLAFLPLQDSHQCSIVWSLPSEMADQYQAMSQDEFVNMLEQAFSCELGKIEHVSERFLFPLIYREVDEYVKGRVVLIGDAAHTIHPMAGQGINMGLLDAASLIDALCDAKFNLSGNVHRYLRQYERARKADNGIMLNGVHMLQRLFVSEVESLQTIRSLGLNVTNQCAWLKNQFTRHAIGNRMDLPKFAQLNA